MKLWLLSQDVNDEYDTYDSCVVVEHTAEEAKRPAKESKYVQKIRIKIAEEIRRIKEA